MTQIPEGFPLPAEKDLRRRYGLTLAQYVALAELQGWVCCICGGPPKPGRPLVADHDHDTLTVDGLAHLMPCNRRLTQSVRRYLADPPGRRLGLTVPAELEAKTIARREAGKELARATRATKAAEKQATRARPLPPPGIDRLRAMTQPDPDQYAAQVARALAQTAAQAGPVPVAARPAPPPEPEPQARRSRRRFRLGGRILSGG